MLQWKLSQLFSSIFSQPALQVIADILDIADTLWLRKLFPKKTAAKLVMLQVATGLVHLQLVKPHLHHLIVCADKTAIVSKMYNPSSDTLTQAQGRQGQQKSAAAYLSGH